jgi:hypothetical protein
LQAAFEGAEQEGDEDREGENALPGERFGIGAMSVDELVIVKYLGEIGEDCGMDTAKRPSYFYPLFSNCYDTYCTTKSLT